MILKRRKRLLDFGISPTEVHALPERFVIVALDIEKPVLVGILVVQGLVVMPNLTI